MKIVFLGSADFGLPALTRIIESKHEVVGIVSTPAKPKGRGLKLAKSPVALFAEAQGISPILTPENLKETSFINDLKALGADLFVVIAYRILPSEVFNMPKWGTINAHASLLPRFRGPAPIHRAIESGDKITGVTIFRLDDGIDTGNIISQEQTEIGSDEDTPELYRRLSAMAADQIMEAIESINNNEVSYQVQDHANATKAPKLKKSEGKIDWDQSAFDIYNKIRAFKPFPGTFTTYNSKKIGIETAFPIEDNSDKTAGTIVNIEKDAFYVSCRKSILKVVDVKPEGKKSMSAKDFLNGAKIKIGDILC